MARKLLQENKRDRAKILLKKKRYLEQLTEKTDNQLDGIEQMVQDIEFSQVQVEVLKNLEKGNAALKKLHDVFSMSDVEKIMDETREGIEKQQEIDDLLSGNLTEDDLAAVEDELNEIMKANLPEVENLPEVPTEEPTLPDIPQGEPTDVPTRKEKTKQEKTALTA
ncbi:charged multivesicular body protein 6-like isoform X2 [Artemia franciscana]